MQWRLLCVAGLRGTVQLLVPCFTSLARRSRPLVRFRPARLVPYGVGPLAPVASNDTDEGRAKNRRVELVKR
jgi:hypothetical protein